MKLAILAAFVFLHACLCVSQEQDAAQRILLKLPDSIRSEDVFVRYQVITDKGGDGGIVRRIASLREYAISVASSLGGRPQKARMVVYSPGCQFKTYVLDVSSGPDDIVQDFSCDSLLTTHLTAVMPQEEVPRSLYFKMDPSLEVVAYLDGDWVCDYFLRREPENKNILAGSCLSASVPLGVVGIVDPERNGLFEVDIPDFTADPTFREFGSARYGTITFGLRDRTTGQMLTNLTRTGSDEQEGRGLRVSSSYPQPVEFSARAAPNSN